MISCGGAIWKRTKYRPRTKLMAPTCGKVLTGWRVTFCPIVRKPFLRKLKVTVMIGTLEDIAEHTIVARCRLTERVCILLRKPRQDEPCGALLVEPWSGATCSMAIEAVPDNNWEPIAYYNA